MKSDTLSLKTVVNEVDSDFFSLKKTVIVQWNDWKKTKRFAAAYEQIKIKNTWSK